MNKYLKVYVLILLKKDFIHEQKTLNSFQFLVVLFKQPVCEFTKMTS